MEVPDPTQAMIGKTIAGRYEIKALLGQGGMGAVYEAVQQPLDRRIALKVIKRSLTDEPVAVKRFIQEAQAAAALSHPHIVTLHDFGQTDDGTLYIAMEFLEGKSVRQELAAHGAMPWQRTVPIVVDVCQALLEAHQRGIIHRDLKPDNIMLLQAAGRSDYAKVVDFGVAKLLDRPDGQSTLTGTGMVVGTPGYISPEQINGVTDDARSDLYALGVVWFEMLTNRSPFEDKTPMKLVVKHLTEKPPQPSHLFPEGNIPPEVDALVYRLLAKEPASRGEGSAQLLAQLQELWARSQGLPPDAATAGMSTSEVDAVKAAAAAVTAPGTPPPTPAPSLPTSSTPPAPAATGALVSAGGPAPSGSTPATGAVAAPSDAERQRHAKGGRKWAIAAVLSLALCGAPLTCLGLAVASNQDARQVEQADAESPGLDLKLKNADGEPLLTPEGDLHLDSPIGGLDVDSDTGAITITPPAPPDRPWKKKAPTDGDKAGTAESSTDSSRSGPTGDALDGETRTLFSGVKDKRLRRDLNALLGAVRRGDEKAEEAAMKRILKRAEKLGPEAVAGVEQALETLASHPAFTPDPGKSKRRRGRGARVRRGER
jgi:serine/threonine-protein kinase